MSEQVTLAACPIGLFRADDGELCLRTEYGNNEGRIDAYIVSSGEFFWGAAPQTIENQRKQMVTPVEFPEPQPIETVPMGKQVLLWIHLPRAPSNSDWILGSIARVAVTDFFSRSPRGVTPLPDDAPLSECCIWDGHQYRPMWATHWFPTPPAPQSEAPSTSLPEDLK